MQKQYRPSIRSLRVEPIQWFVVEDFPTLQNSSQHNSIYTAPPVSVPPQTHGATTRSLSLASSQLLSLGNGTRKLCDFDFVIICGLHDGNGSGSNGALDVSI